MRGSPSPLRERGAGRTADEDAAAAKSRALHEKGIPFPLDLPFLNSGWSARKKAASKRRSMRLRNGRSGRGAGDGTFSGGDGGNSQCALLRHCWSSGLVKCINTS
jgi:hypothetical protein